MVTDPPHSSVVGVVSITGKFLRDGVASRTLKRFWCYFFVVWFQLRRKSQVCLGVGEKRWSYTFLMGFARKRMQRFWLVFEHDTQSHFVDFTRPSTLLPIANPVDSPVVKTAKASLYQGHRFITVCDAIGFFFFT